MPLAQERLVRSLHVHQCIIADPRKAHSKCAASRRSMTRRYGIIGRHCRTDTAPFPSRPSCGEDCAEPRGRPACAGLLEARSADRPMKPDGPVDADELGGIAEPLSGRHGRIQHVDFGESCAVAGTYPVQVGAPETITTERLLLRRPVAADAAAMQHSYAGDAEVTKLLGWPRHLTVDDTVAFISWSDEAWSVGPASPTSSPIGKKHHRVHRARRRDGAPRGTGYVLARDAWGHGYATEATRARWRPSRISSASAGCTRCATPTIGHRYGSSRKRR